MKNYTKKEIQKMINSIATEFSSKIVTIKLTKNQKELIQMIKNNEFISLRRGKTLRQLIDLGLVKTNSLGKITLI